MVQRLRVRKYCATVVLIFSLAVIVGVTQRFSIATIIARASLATITLSLSLFALYKIALHFLPGLRERAHTPPPQHPTHAHPKVGHTVNIVLDDDGVQSLPTHPHRGVRAPETNARAETPETQETPETPKDSTADSPKGSLFDHQETIGGYNMANRESDHLSGFVRSVSHVNPALIAQTIREMIKTSTSTTKGN